MGARGLSRTFMGLHGNDMTATWTFMALRMALHPSPFTFKALF